MTKKNRLRKAWERNYDLWICKGIYYNIGLPFKYWMTPKEVLKDLKRENIEDERMLRKF